MELGGSFSQRDAPYEELKRSRKTWQNGRAIIIVIDEETLGSLSYTSRRFAFPFIYSNCIMQER